MIVSGQHVIQFIGVAQGQFQFALGGQRAGEKQLVAGLQGEIVGRQQQVVGAALDQQRHHRQAALAVGGIGQQAAQFDRSAVHQGLPAGRRLGRIQAVVPDHRRQAGTGCLQPFNQLPALRLVELLHAVEKAGEQRRGEQGDAFLRDDAAGQHGEVGAIGGKQCVVGRLVLAGDDEQFGIEFVGGHRDGQVVDVVVAAGDDAPGLADAGLAQRTCLGAVADDVVVGIAGGGVDDGQPDAGVAQALGNGVAEAAVAAQDPVAVRRLVGFGERRLGQAGEQFDQAETLGRGDGQRQAVGEAFVGIDDVVGAEGGHVGGDRLLLGAGDDRNARIEQADGDGDGQVGLVVVGHRQHAPAFGVAQAGQAQVVRQARIGGEGRGVGLEVEEVEFLDAQLVLLQHHEGLADVVEAARDQAARFAAAADQVEILAGMAHAAGEAVGGQRVLEALVLEQGDQRDHRIRPADDGQVDADGDPQALPVGEGDGNFAEADGRRRVADEIEGVEEGERGAGLALGVDARHQRQAENGDRVDDDQHDDRRPHAAEHQEEGAVHGGSPSGAASRFRR